MQLDPNTRAELGERLALLRQVRDAMLQTPPGAIPNAIDHAMALRALEGDIARFEAAVAG